MLATQPQNFNLPFWVLALILILLFFGYWLHQQEFFSSTGGSHIYTSGATMRVIGQQFTSTDQGAEHFGNPNQKKTES
jgi:multidrug resistance efflux pump